MSASEQELRAMVLDFALELARKCVEQVNDTDLDFGSMNDSVDVAGTKWDVGIRFWRDVDLLKIEGHPHAEQDEAIEGMPPIVRQMFMTQEAPDGTFEFVLPRIWLPASQRAHV